jgi:hypothetical protein
LYLTRLDLIAPIAGFSDPQGLTDLVSPVFCRSNIHAGYSDNNALASSIAAMSSDASLTPLRRRS